MYSLDRYFSDPLGERDVVDEMRYEWLRLKSFSTFPQTSSQSSVRLARSGFYFTGRNQECICFSCGLHHSSWTRGNITEIHKKLSPSCRHLHGNDDTNVPIRSTESSPTNPLHSELSFCGADNIQTVPPTRQTSGKTQKQPSGSNNAYTQNLPNLSQQSISQPNRLKETLEPLGIVTDRPRYPSYAILATRVSSFQQWPSHLTQTPRDLSLAGFFYAGYGDYVRCFFCGGGLRNWEPGDDAWVEHARWFPKCPFLIQNRGLNFVRLVQSVHTEGSKDTASQEQRETQADFKQLPAAQEILQMGYPWDTIKEAYRNLNKNCTDVTSAELIEEILANNSSTPTYVQALSSLNDNGEIPESSVTPVYSKNETKETQIMIEENRRLKEQRLCRICMEEDIAITFLPCGHFCCCIQCAPAMRKCPICREFIKGTVRTYPA